MNSIIRKLSTAFAVYGDSGLDGVRRRLIENRYSRKLGRQYREWLDKYGRLTDADRESIRSSIDSFKSPPLLSVILPVYNVDENWLRLCIESVIKQIYPHWELCIADDASTAEHIRRVLSEYAAKDNRISLSFRSENGHISAASNTALQLARGEFSVLLDHDDELSEDALFWVASEIDRHPETAMIYSDEDLIDERGRRYGPKFKPDFSRDLLYSLNLITHLSAYSTELLIKIGGFRLGVEGSQDFDLALRVLEQVPENQIRHIPRILYHWRVIRGSVSFSMDEKPYAHERARDAIREHLARRGVAASVTESIYNLHRVSYDLPDPPPRISVIVSGENLDTCDGMPYSEYDAQMIFAGSRRAEQLNNAAAEADGDILLFLDGDLRWNPAESLCELAGFAIQPDVGCAGGRILTPDLFVEEAGFVIGADLVPSPAHRGFPREVPGNMLRNRQVGNFSAISSSCMVIRSDLFREMGGFDSSAFPEDLFDIDLCLRLRETGKRVVVVPHVELIRRYDRRDDLKTSASELVRFRTRWQKYEELDPFCNPNLKRDGSFEIADR
jgi:O-antigen biosynthesis protein